MYVIDDDASVRRSLNRLMRSARMQAVAYARVAEFLESDYKQSNACIVADVHIPEDDSLSLPGRLREIGVDIPVIFITADYSAETRERIRKAGGRAYFGKPVDDQALIDMIRWSVRSP